MSINENVIVNPARLTGAGTVAMGLGHATKAPQMCRPTASTRKEQP
jgi:hypothetical protein